MSESVEAEYTDSDTAVAIRPVDALTEFGQDEIGMDRGLRVANQLDAIIREKDLAVTIGQGEHLRVEAWCACAAMVGVSPRTVWTKRTPESGALVGYTARVEVVQIATGQVIGAAEAGCFMSEMQWSKRDKCEVLRWKEEHAVLSMSQTRATSKAIGQVLRWIPVLAGYSGTPAEEMPRGTPEDTVRPQPQREYQQGDGAINASRRKHTAISEKQKKFLYAISIKRAEAIIDERVSANLPLKYEDAKALRGSIVKHACAAANVGSEVHSDEIDMLKDCIERAMIDAHGCVVIQSETFE